ncbi:MAG: nucleoside phosphorylase [Legionellaceae bacterium]|nr:nucleoside phosphorylase [Legionellaceae bacterium]
MLKIAELPLNERRAVYHLDLLPTEIADTIITVGDPKRVALVSRHFDAIECQRQQREFVTHTGRIGNKRISVLSTGIGMPNIDIVMNELDALFNIDLARRQVCDTPRAFTLIRLGTTGTLQADIALGEILLSQYAIGFDSLMDYYEPDFCEEKQNFYLALREGLASFTPAFFVSRADRHLLEHFRALARPVITATCGGFYAPQGRKLRKNIRHQTLWQYLTDFRYQNLRVSNIEMETAAILGLGEVFGHRCLSLSVVVANRPHGSFSDNIEQDIERMIEKALASIERLPT